MAYDGKSKTVVLFGGNAEFSDRGGELNDTWIWNGTAWKKRNPSTSPPSREHASMAYDAATGTVVLFGGTSDTCGTFTDATCAKFNDTWIWNGIAQTWTQMLTPVSPSARSGAGMAFDKVRGKVVLFGGIPVDKSETFLNDTWTWDGNARTWTQQLPAKSPPERSHAAMALDQSGKLVLFSGYASKLVGTPAADTWTWDGANWSEKTPTSKPPYRVGAAMAYDTARTRTVLFGGSQQGLTNNTHTARSDTWVWNGTNETWKELVPAASPTGRFFSSAAYDAARQQVVVFGGSTQGGVLLNDTWVWNGTNWKQKAA